jgi:HTH-type transcriptional regulator, transcriptional repressor of NAD biosynthesis genes
MTRFRTGLVVGKFAPLHLGHEHVIRAALAACDHVVLLSYSRPEFPGCEPARRATWLAARFPQTTRIVLDHAVEPLPDNSDSDDTHRAFCSSILRRHLDRPIDAVFTSESYGPGFAADLARCQGSPVAHVSIDPARAAIPVSGTALRADIHGLRRFLAPEVYATFVERVALLGGESTGKSTLAVALARELGTTHVAEYGRELWDVRAGQLAFEDLLAIAHEQIRREEAAVLSPDTHHFVICDTTPLTTLFYSHELFGRVAPELVSLSLRPYDHVVLCADDFPFVQDGTRRDETFRTHGQHWYQARLTDRAYHLASGSLETRISALRTRLNVAIVNAATNHAPSSSP